MSVVQQCAPPLKVCISTAGRAAFGSSCTTPTSAPAVSNPATPFSVTAGAPGTAIFSTGMGLPPSGAGLDDSVSR